MLRLNSDTEHEWMVLVPIDPFLWVEAWKANWVVPLGANACLTRLWAHWRIGREGICTICTTESPRPRGWHITLSHARDQWFPTYKLRICQIWAKIPLQNHFRIRTLIFPSVQSSSDSVHYRQRDIFRKKLTQFDPWSPVIEPWYPGVV
jgi:hypothetical protein